MNLGDFSNFPATIIILLINIIVSLLGFYNRNITEKAIMWPYGVKRHQQYYRFISSGFIHADFMHLFFNMFTFYFFGQNLEKIFIYGRLGGSISFIILYFLALIVSDLPSYFKHKDDSNYLSLGASGAVSAVVFGSILFMPWDSIYIWGAIKISAALYAVLYIVYCVYMSKRNIGNVNHDAHLWGSLFGLIFTFLIVAVLQPDLIGLILEQLKHPSLLGN
ncbi:rhomboid family intramembrane serine protease [Ferruginibacter albus]|uniref:rhomboid family intramembrane serine protease n=1 Tax=Ferruginibacter albus TaxID=2875540 RepID=UPI001CC79FB4|nr:rhomboid family intramembrane serine protease [Ferruginibacter albus]UAY53174.1 rhomboid family intramembrane serine protease [Ferruginibacter albus]